jgi:hypothetical protein
MMPFHPFPNRFAIHAGRCLGVDSPVAQAGMCIPHLLSAIGMMK